MNFPTITDQRMHDVVQSDGMMRSGLDYFRQSRVGEVAFDAALNVASAQVRGSGRNRYMTSVIFQEDPTDVLIDSECSCPVGFGCKHVAALLYWLREMVPQKPRLRIEAGAREAASLSGAVGEWLQGVTVDRLAATLSTEPVCFVIEPKRAFKQARPGKRKPTDRGVPDRFVLQIRAWRKTRHAPDWRICHPYELQNSNARVDPQVVRLLGRMAPIAAGGDFTADKAPSGRYGWQWLCDAATADLLRWKKPDGPLVTIAPETVHARLEWHVSGDGRRSLSLAGMDERLRIVVGDPPMVIDEPASTIGLIDTGIAPALAGRLLAMPPIGLAEIPLLARRWADIAGDAVPAPTMDDVVEIEHAPRPVLRFMLDKVECRVKERAWSYSRFQQVQHKIVRLAFDYAGHRITAPAPFDETIVAGADGGVARILRHRAAEQAAVDRLDRTALLPLALIDGVRTKPHQGWDHALAADVGDYPALLVNEIEALKRDGWLIEYAPDWPYALHKLDAPPLGLAITPGTEPPAKSEIAGMDWFDLELPALVDGSRIDVLPALRQVLAEEGAALLDRADDHQLALTLDQERFTAIALGTVRPLLAALLRLALADRQASTLRVNRFDLGTVHDLANGGIGWTSEDALRRLGAALHDPEQADYATPAGLVAELRPYQRAGAAWLAALHGAGLGGILADDMGLGKTLQAIAHILHVREAAASGDGAAPGPVLVVAPTSVLPNWQAELARFAPHLNCLLWHGSERRHAETALAEAAVIVTSYPLLARDKDILARQHYDLIVFDEAHVLKNPATVGFKAAIALKAGQTIALSGTPLENRLNDIWALASLTNAGLLGGFDSFRKTYRAPIEKHGDTVARGALARRLRPFLLRRTKDQVAADLPPKTLIPERLELGDAQLRLYESQRLLMNQRIRQEIDRVGLMRSQIIVLDAMLKLRQICCDPSLLPGGQGEGVASAKRARLLEMMPDLLDEGRRVIVFSQFTKMLDRLSADLTGAGIEHEHLRGSTRDRARPVRRFQEGEVAVILISLKAGGAGVNLTAADTVILYDPWWNPAVEAQAIDRAHRIGQTKPVFVHRMIATGTIEEKILALQERKQDLADMLWSEAGSVTGAGLDEDDIAFLLG